MRFERMLLTGFIATTVVGALIGCAGKDSVGAPQDLTPTPDRATFVEGGEAEPTSQVSLAVVGRSFLLAEEGGDVAIPVEVTVTKFRCGIKSYPFKASAISGSIPEDAAAVPGSGQQFCQADLSVKNVGKKPLKDGSQPGKDALIMVKETEYASTDLSNAIVYTFLSEVNNTGKSVGWFAGDVINPGESVRQIQVWEIPAIARPNSVAFTTQLGEGGPSQVQVKVT